MIKISTAKIFVYLSLFCYISILPIFKTDVQPYFVLAAILFFLNSKYIKLPYEFNYVLITCFVALILLFLDFVIYDFYLPKKLLQKLSKYFVFFISAISFYKYLKLYGFPIKPIKVFCYVSLFVGLIQFFINKRFTQNFFIK